MTIIALGEEGNQVVGGLREELILESDTITPILNKHQAMGI